MCDVLQHKISRLRKYLEQYPAVAVAFSGGVDSTFLLKTAQEVLGSRVVAITAVAPNFSSDEIEEAKDFCITQGIAQVMLDLGDSAVNVLAENTPDRCYHCKKMVFGQLQKALRDMPGFEGAALADGTNRDDGLDYRPGERAIAELGVISPLKESDLTKAEIREALRLKGLSVWDKPAFACLASRIPYGERITSEKMQSVYLLEKALHQLGFRQVRARHHGNVVRIEVLPEDRLRFMDEALMDAVNEAALDAGFLYAALDLGGYRMGSLNKLIKSKD